MKNPIVIERKDDKREFIHLGKGMYKSLWGIKNNDIREFSLKEFNKNEFNFYFINR